MKSAIKKRFIVAMVLAVFWGASSLATAEVLFYDPFLIGSDPVAGEYVLGDLDPTSADNDGQNPTVGPTPFLSGAWRQQADAPNAQIQESGLSYLGSPALGGSLLAVPNARTRRLLPTPWDAAKTGTYFISFFVNYGEGFYDDGIQGNDLGYRSVEFWNATGGFLMNIGYNTYSSAIGPEQQDPATARMYMGLGGVEQILDGSPDTFMVDGLTHLIVARFTLSDQPGSDSVSLFLDPISTMMPDLPAASRSGIDITLGALSGVSLFGGSGSFPTYDELRVSTTFGEALPVLPRPGDVDGDLDVDLDDYEIIAAHYNQEVGSIRDGDVAKADGTQGIDGFVGITDYRIWRDNYNPPAGSGGLVQASVPEPVSAVILLWVAAIAAGARLRR